MQVKSIAECSKGSILQYFRPLLSYQLSLRPLLCLFWVSVLHWFYCICEEKIMTAPIDQQTLNPTNTNLISRWRRYCRETKWLHLSNRHYGNIWHPVVLDACLQPRNYLFSNIVKPVLSDRSERRPKFDSQDQLSHAAARKYCRMRQREHSAILLTDQ